MAAPTNYYVDPLNGNDSTGDGTSGTPWKSVQKALNTITRNATNGDQINVKAGAADVLSAALSITTYGVSTVTAPLILRGYTSVAGDGGVGEISGGGSVGIIAHSAPFVLNVVDMYLHNCGSATMIDMTTTNGGALYAVRSKIGNTTGNLINLRGNAYFYGCHLFTLSQVIAGVNPAPHSHLFWGCFLDEVTRTAPNSWSHDAFFNIFYGSALREIGANGAWIVGNTFDSKSNAVNNGITFRNAASNSHIILNNLFTNFTTAATDAAAAVGGNTTQTVTPALYGNNYFYNCSKNVSDFVDTTKGALAALDVTLGSSPYVGNIADLDFRVSTDLKALAFPTTFLGSITNQFMDIGAAQRQEAGGLAVNPIGAHFIRGLIQ